MLVANSAQIRAADTAMTDDYAFPSLLLMEAAGRKAARFLLTHYPGIAHYLILAGPGNNGGDGLVLARYLQAAGKSVWVILTHDPSKLSGDPAAHYAHLKARGVPMDRFEAALLPAIERYLAEGTLMIDAMLGTGVQGPLRGDVAEVVDFLKRQRNFAVALDLPSGLSADTGAVESPPLKCRHTLSFQLPKICHYVSPAATHCGQTVVLDIGILPEVIESQAIRTHHLDDAQLRRWYRPRDPEAHKGSFGHVLIAGGSKGMSGAVAMAAQAAMEIGAGLCTAFIPGSISCAFQRTSLENMSVPYGPDNTAHLNETAADVMGTYLEDKQVLAVGPGLGQTPETAAFLRSLFALEVDLPPLVLDADALNLLAEHDELWQHLGPDTVLTPHPGEMARLLKTDTADIQARRYEVAGELAQKRGVMVVLKGTGTIIATPDGETYLSTTGNAGMATGGAGDVLTGAIAGLIAQGYEPAVAAAMGVYLHGKAGDALAAESGVEGIVATKIMRRLGKTLHETVGPPAEEGWLPEGERSAAR